MATINWGVLGVANIAVRAVIPALQHARNARLVGIASRTAARAQEAAQRLGIPRAFGSYEALVADPEIQAIYIPLPNSMHREWTLRCAAAGKHVLCEKPLAVSTADCEAMIAGCRRHGVTLMEAFMYRFHPRTERVLEIVRAGEIGDVRLVRASFTFATRERRGNIRFAPELGGGALNDVGCYTTNICRAVLGEPTAVAAFGMIGTTGVDEIAAGTLQFLDGRVGLIDCGIVLARRETYEIVGSTGRVVVPDPGAFLPTTSDTTIEIMRGPDHELVTIPGTDQYQRMVEHFGDVLSGAPLALPPEDAVGNVRTTAALRASLEQGPAAARPV